MGPGFFLDVAVVSPVDAHWSSPKFVFSCLCVTDDFHLECNDDQSFCLVLGAGLCSPSKDSFLLYSAEIWGNVFQIQTICKNRQSKQNVKMSQEVNIWEGAQCYASHLQIFTRQVRWHISKNNIYLVTIIVSWIGILKWELFKKYKMNT